MTSDVEAFWQRIKEHPRGLPGVNERFGSDPFLISVCGHLHALFIELEKGAERSPVPPKRFSLHDHVKDATDG